MSIRQSVRNLFFPVGRNKDSKQFMPFIWPWGHKLHLIQKFMIFEIKEFADFTFVNELWLGNKSNLYCKRKNEKVATYYGSKIPYDEMHVLQNADSGVFSRCCFFSPENRSLVKILGSFHSFFGSFINAKCTI